MAWIHEGLTIQLDLTLLYAIGSRAPVRERYDDSTNFVGQLWVGYAALPWLTLGAELRHQRFVDAPAPIRGADAAMPDGPTQAYQTSLAGGVRLRIPLGSVTLLLAASYARGLDGWMWAHDDNVFQLDLPFAF